MSDLESQQATVNNSAWQNAQKHEQDYWGNCLGMRAWGEFCKQEMYGREMGLFAEYGDDAGELNMRHRSVLDLGGGPVSMLLRSYNVDQPTIVDPCNWPESVHRRYANYKIHFVNKLVEDLTRDDIYYTHWNEVWIYNVLQHVKNPDQVLKKAIERLEPNFSKLRIFEWVHIDADDCHPHVLTPEGILNWLKGCKIEKIGLPRLKEFWSDATAFTGVFSV